MHFQFLAVFLGFASFIVEGKSFLDLTSVRVKITAEGTPLGWSDTVDIPTTGVVEFEMPEYGTWKNRSCPVP